MSELQAAPDPEAIRVDSVVPKIQELFEQLPLAYKQIVTHPDVLLVLAGLKGATDTSFLGNTFNEADYAVFASLVQSAGLRLTPLEVSYGTNNTPRRHGLIYNPAVIAKETANSEFAPVYDGQMELMAYANEAERQGYPVGGIFGKIYSFPESAIGNYLEREKHLKWSAALDVLRLRRKSAVYTGGETYWYFGAPKADVLKREDQKKTFFSLLNNHPTFQNIKRSELNAKSVQAWSDNLPAFIRSR